MIFAIGGNPLAIAGPCRSRRMPAADLGSVACQAADWNTTHKHKCETMREVKASLAAQRSFSHHNSLRNSLAFLALASEPNAPIRRCMSIVEKLGPLIRSSFPHVDAGAACELLAGVLDDETLVHMSEDQVVLRAEVANLEYAVTSTEHQILSEIGLLRDDDAYSRPPM